MIIKTEDYLIENFDQNRVKVSGVLRLPSPISFEAPFKSIMENISAGPESYTTDITDLNFLNSSGINAIARLIILARTKNVPLKILGNQNIPWQSKSIASLGRLWEKMTIELA